MGQCQFQALIRKKAICTATYPKIKAQLCPQININKPPKPFPSTQPIAPPSQKLGMNHFYSEHPRPLSGTPPINIDKKIKETPARLPQEAIFPLPDQFKSHIQASPKRENKFQTNNLGNSRPFCRTGPGAFVLTPVRCAGLWFRQLLRPLSHSSSQSKAFAFIPKVLVQRSSAHPQPILRYAHPVTLDSSYLRSHMRPATRPFRTSKYRPFGNPCRSSIAAV